MISADRVRLFATGVLEATVLLTRKAVTDSLDNLSLDDFPVVLSKPMPHPPDKIGVCKMPVGPVGFIEVFEFLLPSVFKAFVFIRTWIDSITNLERERSATAWWNETHKIWSISLSFFFGLGWSLQHPLIC